MDELTADQCMALLTAEEVAHVGVISDDEPYVTPISYVMLGDEMLFRTAGGRRLEAIRASPRVCVEVSTSDPDTGDWQSVIAWGTGRVVGDDAKSADTVALLLEKYRHLMGSPLSTGVATPLADVFIVSVELERITGRTSGSGLLPRSRPGYL